MSCIKFYLANNRSFYLFAFLLTGLLLISCNKDNPDDEEFIENRLIIDGTETEVVDIYNFSLGPIGVSTNQIVTEIFNKEGDVLAFYMRSFTNELPIGSYQYQRDPNVDFETEGANGGGLTWNNKQYIPFQYVVHLSKNVSRGTNDIKISGEVVLATEALAGNFDNKVKFEAEVGIK